MKAFRKQHRRASFARCISWIFGFLEYILWQQCCCHGGAKKRVWYFSNWELTFENVCCTRPWWWHNFDMVSIFSIFVIHVVQPMPTLRYWFITEPQTVTNWIGVTFKLRHYNRSINRACPSRLWQLYSIFTVRLYLNLPLLNLHIDYSKQLVYLLIGRKDEFAIGLHLESLCDDLISPSCQN